MSRNAISAFVMLASAAVFGSAAFAADVPTLHQVYQATQAGKLDEAQGMMKEVIQAHPNSGKAHFVEAEILAKQGRSGNAEVELNTAERLEPGLPFARPQAVQELKARIATLHRSQSTMNGVPAAAAAGFPWGLLLLGIGSIVLITLLVRAMTARNRVPMAGTYPAATSGPAGQPYMGGGVTPMAPAGGGLGSSIVSGLATGAAVGAGMVAGEALVHHFMDGGKSGADATVPASDSRDSSSDNMGGADFGIADNSSWDDNSSVADSGDVGGDDWS